MGDARSPRLKKPERQRLAWCSINAWFGMDYATLKFIAYRCLLLVFFAYHYYFFFVLRSIYKKKKNLYKYRKIYKKRENRDIMLHQDTLPREIH